MPTSFSSFKAKPASKAPPAKSVAAKAKASAPPLILQRRECLERAAKSLLDLAVQLMHVLSTESVRHASKVEASSAETVVLHGDLCNALTDWGKNFKAHTYSEFLGEHASFFDMLRAVKFQYPDSDEYLRESAVQFLSDLKALKEMSSKMVVVNGGKAAFWSSGDADLSPSQVAEMFNVGAAGAFGGDVGLPAQDDGHEPGDFKFRCPDLTGPT